VLPTIADDVSHGGNVWGVVSASYTDLGGAGGIPPLTTVDQQNVRQKLQQVEFALNQSGTNTANSSDVGGGQHRGSLSNNDWIELNGPFNPLRRSAWRTPAAAGRRDRRSPPSTSGRTRRPDRRC
jgi:hypothetical protein